MSTRSIFSWLFRLGAALVLLQTLYFKFSAHPDSVHIFSTLGVEPWGRIASGVLELILAGLLLYRRTAWLGATGSIGVMAGALWAHLTQLGIEVQGDGGRLFALALIVLVCSLGTLYLHWGDARAFFRRGALQ